MFVKFCVVLFVFMPVVVNTTNCFLSIDDLDDYITATQEGGSRGAPVLFAYQYSEYIDDSDLNFKDVVSSTPFEVGKKYKLRILMYVDDAFIRYEDSKVFEIKSDFSINCQSTFGLIAPETTGGAFVTLLLPTVTSGTVDEWSVDNGLTVSNTNITGTLPLGDTEVTITAKRCNVQKTCKSTITVIKEVGACETNAQR